jgi:hypothetical protein
VSEQRFKGGGDVAQQFFSRGVGYVLDERVGRSYSCPRGTMEDGKMNAGKLNSNSNSPLALGAEATPHADPNAHVSASEESCFEGCKPRPTSATPPASNPAAELVKPASVAARRRTSSPVPHDGKFLANNQSSIIDKLNKSLGKYIVSKPVYDPFFDCIKLSVRVETSSSERVHPLRYRSASVGSWQAFQDNFNADAAFLGLVEEYPQFKLLGVQGTDNVKSGKVRQATVRDVITGSDVTFAGEDFDKLFDRKTGTIDVAFLKDGWGVAKCRGLPSVDVSERKAERLAPPFFLDLSV